jgi:hypothetical protein
MTLRYCCGNKCTKTTNILEVSKIIKYNLPLNSSSWMAPSPLVSNLFIIFKATSSLTTDSSCVASASFNSCRLIDPSWLVSKVANV